MLAYSTSRGSHIRAFELFSFISGTGFHLLFSLHKGCWEKVSAGPSASWPCTGDAFASDAVWGLAQILSDSALFISAHGREATLLHKSSEIERTLQKCQVVTHSDWAVQLFELYSSLTPCPRLWTITSNLKQGTLLSYHTQPRYEEKVASLFLFQRKFLAMGHAGCILPLYRVVGWWSALGVRTCCSSSSEN